jgi:hypothetical protein
VRFALATVVATRLVDSGEVTMGGDAKQLLNGPRVQVAFVVK